MQEDEKTWWNEESSYIRCVFGVNFLSQEKWFYGCIYRKISEEISATVFEVNFLRVNHQENVDMKKEIREDADGPPGKLSPIIILSLHTRTQHQQNSQ